VKGVNQLHSSISTIIKVEENKRSAAEETNGPNKRVDLRDRQGCDIFGWSNHRESAESFGKRRNNDHAAVQHNGNLTHWDK
jgi:hypothetical protein